MDFVLFLLIVMLVGSVAATFLVPPFLTKINRRGEVNFYGIKFPPKLP